MRVNVTLSAMRAAVVVACGIAVVAAAPQRASAADGDKTFVMKLSTATINDTQHEWMKRFVAAEEKDSGGKIKGEIYPASQLGTIPRQIEGTQFGSIQGWIGPPEFLAGIDERFEIMTAPAVIQSVEQAVRVSRDPELKTMLLGLGAEKGLMGVGFFISAPVSIVTRKPVRHLAEFKGLKLRTLASPFESEQIKRLGATPVAMTLGDVLPAIQQGAIDGGVAQVAVFTTMHYFDAAKFITQTNQRYIFSVAEISKKWFTSLPPDLQKIIVENGDRLAEEVSPWGVDFFNKEKKTWTDHGGELIDLPPQEQAAMMESMASIGDDLSKDKPGLKKAYETLVAAAKRTK
jgi:TRAP-type C4-dicarboxylate transport system substrate-binding protein